MNYHEKLEKLETIIRPFLSDFINFADFKELNLDNKNVMDEITSCFNLEKNDCENSLFCNYITTTDGGICKLLLPKDNLINETNNEKFYYLKMIDELIRHIKIRNYLLTFKSFVSFKDTKYKINNDEILLLEEELNDKFRYNITLNSKEEYSNDVKLYDMTNPNDDESQNQKYMAAKMNYIDITSLNEGDQGIEYDSDGEIIFEFTNYRDTANCKKKQQNKHNINFER